MDTVKKPKLGLTNNQLKIIAMVSMLLDHMGLLFFPDEQIFRILGRIAFPIFAYMIAEGSSLRSVNIVGLQRRGFAEEDIRAIKFAYRKLFLDNGKATSQAGVKLNDR